MTVKDEVFCRDFLAGNTPRYAFGATAQSVFLAKTLGLEGIVDDYLPEPEFQGVKIVRLSAVSSEAMLVSGIVFGRPVSARKALDARGLRNMDFFMFVRLSGLPLPDFAFFFHPQFEQAYKRHRNRYAAVREKLADAESVRIFDCLINFRLTSSLEYMHGFTLDAEQQYFDKFPGEQENSRVFVDVGAFDGQTSLAFAARHPDYHSIHLFEADPVCQQRVAENIAPLRQAQLYPYAVSDRQQTLHFHSQGSFSEVAHGGDTAIASVPLDDILQVDPDFIKMDIEGHELQALTGAQQIISRCTPKLAISAYHKIDDFWEIPERVFSINPHYRLYMRHYTEGLLETVYYFIPAARSHQH